MRHLRKQLSDGGQNIMLQSQNTSRLSIQMVSKSTGETPLAHLPILQSGPASLPTQPTGWISNIIITTIAMGGCAASFGILEISMGRQHASGKRLFFLEFLNLYVPSNVFVYQTFRGIHLATIRRYENRRISRFLAQTKREAIRRLRFELANLLDF